MRILKNLNLENLIFLDIETAPATNNLTEDHPLYDAWEYHTIKNNIDDVQSSFFEKAALHGEFGIIVAITMGLVRNGKMYLHTFTGEERQLLQDFSSALCKTVNKDSLLCGHVIKGFDIPFIMKRLLVNRLELPPILDIAGLKPWESSIICTAELWKGTAFKMSSLISITSALGLPSPKDDISGAQVGEAFYRGEIDRIARYCENDVAAVINIVRILRGEEPLERGSAPEKKQPQGILSHLFKGNKYDDKAKETLKKAFDSLSEEEKPLALEILNSIPSKAKGKVTDLEKKHVKELIDG